MSNLLVAKSKWKDKPSTWDSAFVDPYPTGFNPIEYQEALNEIAGFSKHGKEVLQVKWAGNYKSYDKLDGVGNPIIEPKYKLVRQYITVSGFYFVPIRRWIIEEHMTPEQLGVGDDEDILHTDEYNILRKVANKPKEGTYTPLVYVGNHEFCPRDCCKERICLGDYKDPDKAELDYLKECTNKLKRERITNPHEKINPLQLQKILAEANLKLEKEKIQQQKAFNEYLDNISESDFIN